MKTPYITAALLVSGCTLAWAQDPKQALQQKLAEVKQSVAENQARLKTYRWVETTEVSLKGEVKKREQKECRYGPDGKVQKTSITAPAEPKKSPRGLKGKVVEKKVDELKDYMERFGSLLSRYVPPDPSQMQAAFQSGKASLAAGTLAFSDYAKPGDKVTFNLNPSTKKLQNFNVATYLDGPEDAVGVDARFAGLPDGTNFVQETILTSKSKQLQIKITNFDHAKAAQ